MLLSLSLLPLAMVVGDEATVHELPDYTVNAWHFEQSELNVPADVVVIDREQIDASAAVSVPDILRDEANLVFRSFNGKSNQGEADIRGFGEGSGLRVLVLVDGIKVNRADMGNIEWQTLPLRDVETIEVLRGGHNVLYGNHALSGVIKITTRKGGDARANASAFVGSYGYQNYDASFAEGVGDFYFRVNANVQEDDGYRENSDSWSRGIKVDMGYFLGDWDELSSKTSASVGYLQYPGPLLYDEMQEDPRQSTNGGKQFGDSTNYRQTLSWYAVREWGEFEIHGGYNRRELEWSLDGIYGDNDQDGFSLTPKFRVGEDAHFITFGVDLLYDALIFTDFLDDQRAIERANADLSRATFGGYLFGQRELSEEVFVSGGARYEYASTDYFYEKYVENQLNPYAPEFDDPFAPNPNYKNPPDVEESYDDRLSKQGWSAELSVNYRPNEGLSIWAGYDRVYRYPVLDEVAAYQGFALAKPLNEDLEPEVGDNYEFGVKYRSGQWSASATAFYLALENEIAYDSDVNLNVNIGATRRTGADLSLSYDAEVYGASTQWSIVDARFDGGENDGQFVPLVAPVNSVSQFWVRPVQSVRTVLIVNYVGERYQGGDYSNNGTRKLDDYFLLDAQAVVDVTASVRAYLRVNNLLDELYATTAYRGSYYPGVGRNFVLGLNVDF
ncbi:TonB-dependent receptor [Coraliomargarita akajimensis]|uniref:TonB-dependent receptor n=1 Tax=Coraliomargarita akajimensis TaxID=395922 RepID=UPI0011D1482F|nr:TonB-dependent receptor [Coraliomargarita akajimensis]